MLSQLKAAIHNSRIFGGILLAIRHPIRTLHNISGYLYGAYLTIRYVDRYSEFPAIRFQGPPFSLSIVKGRGAKLYLDGALLVTRFWGLNHSALEIGRDSTLHVHNEFIIGNDIKIKIFDNAMLDIRGKDRESGSGISGRSIVMVYHYLSLGLDALIAWDTFITDCDWHPIEGATFSEDTVIGDHVWIASGVKILKGVRIGQDSIVGSQSVVTSGEYPPRSLIAGIPARVIKSDIPSWHR